MVWNNKLWSKSRQVDWTTRAVIACMSRLARTWVRHEKHAEESGGGSLEETLLKNTLLKARHVGLFIEESHFQSVQWLLAGSPPDSYCIARIVCGAVYSTLHIEYGTLCKWREPNMSLNQRSARWKSHSALAISAAALRSRFIYILCAGGVSHLGARRWEFLAEKSVYTRARCQACIEGASR